MYVPDSWECNKSTLALRVVTMHLRDSEIVIVGDVEDCHHHSMHPTTILLTQSKYPGP